jgi:hypothetical protein
MMDTHGHVRVLEPGEAPEIPWAAPVSFTLTVQSQQGTPLTEVMRAIRSSVAAIGGLHPRVQIHLGADNSPRAGIPRSESACLGCDGRGCDACDGTGP